MEPIYEFYDKMSVPRDDQEDMLARQKADRAIFFILLAAISVVPLLVGGHVSQFVSPIISKLSFFASEPKGDVFTYYKFLLLLIITVIVVSIFLYKLLFLNYHLPNRTILLFFLLFAFGIVLSTLFAPYKMQALYGQPTRWDGAVAYICYLSLMFVAMHIEYPKKAMTYVLYSLYPFVFLNFFLCMMNFTGHDVLTYESVRKIFSLGLPESMALSKQSILLGTLNQWNYMSGAFAVMTILYLSSAVIEKSTVQKMVHVFVSLICMTIVFMSISTSGFLTIILLLPLLLFVCLKLEHRKAGIAVIVAFLIMCVPIFHILASKDPRVWSESVGFFLKHNPYEQPNVSQQTSKGETDFLKPSHVYAAEKESFSLPKLPEPNVAPGSGRLYIWEKTLEVVKQRPLLGYGLDTLPYHFPQDDIDKRGGLGTDNIVVDKPHNVYIGILYGTGIAGFIGFMGIVLITVWKWLQCLWKYTEEYKFILVLGFAWVAYLFQSLFNDTLPGTAAPLWTMAGVMMAYIYSESRKEIEQM